MFLSMPFSFLIVINSGNYLPTSINITNNDVLYTAQSNTYIGTFFTDTSNVLSNYTYQYSFDLSHDTTYNNYFDFSVNKTITTLTTTLTTAFIMTTAMLI